MNTTYITRGAPCYDCPERKPGCHGNCDRYKAWRTKADDEIAKAKAEQKSRVRFQEMRENGMRRAGSKLWQK